jgi:hypothetical protein
VVTLVSDVPNSRRHRFVGIDNSAAGRTAGTLMGRFAGSRNGPVGMIAAASRCATMSNACSASSRSSAPSIPSLRALPALEGRDDTDRCRMVAEKLLAEQPDLVGIYSIGAGNRGIADAMKAAGRERDVIFIGHELTDHSRRYLMQGTMAAIINQDPGHEARSAGAHPVGAMRQSACGRRPGTDSHRYLLARQPVLGAAHVRRHRSRHVSVKSVLLDGKNHIVATATSPLEVQRPAPGFLRTGCRELVAGDAHHIR